MSSGSEEVERGEARVRGLVAKSQALLALVVSCFMGFNCFKHFLSA